MRLLVAVGSHPNRVCSVGAFARAEVQALRTTFERVELLEPDAKENYPKRIPGFNPDVILFHAPSLHDRKRPWNALTSALKLRLLYPRALFVPVVHEFSEAPLHWKMRQAAIVRLSSAAIVNTEADYDGIKIWRRGILRARLGPTLFYPELLTDQPEQALSTTLTQLRERARSEIGRRYPDIGESKRWLVHPGLLTPGKGIESLAGLAPSLPESTRIILMGGMGPKDRDREFARQTLNSLRESTRGNFTFLDAPEDTLFQKMLVASDLIVLPFDQGVSERRSSFLSSMCCGANVWTTTGPFSAALQLSDTGVWLSDAATMPKTVSAALQESEAEQHSRRLRNLHWARNRTWQNRVVKIEEFLRHLTPVPHHR